MKDVKKIDTPITSKDILVHLDPNYCKDQSTVIWYLQSVGSIIYTITKTRFDISFTVSTISYFANNSSLKHVVTIKRIFQYFKQYSSL